MVGPTDGEVSIVGGRLRIGFNDYGSPYPAAWRMANLTAPGPPTLSFDYETLVNESTDVVEVRVSRDGGASWVALDAFSGCNAGSKSYDISAYISDKTSVMFAVVNRYGASADFFYADNVQIAFSP